MTKLGILRAEKAEKRVDGIDVDAICELWVVVDGLQNEHVGLT